MKKLIPTLIVSATILASLFLLSRTDIYIKSAWSNQIDHTIAVAGDGKVLAQPDMMKLTVATSEKGKTTALAQEQTNIKVKQIQELLMAAWVNSKDIQSSQISVYPEYNYVVDSSSIVWYVSNHQLTITINDITEPQKVATIIDDVASIWGIQVQNIMYDIKDKTAVYQQARELAFAKAKAKAEQLAKLANVKLGDVIVINENQSTNYSPMPYMRNSLAADMGGVSMEAGSVNPGQLEYNLDLNIVYSIN